MCAAFRSHRKSATSSGSRSRPSARQFNRDVLTLDEAATPYERGPHCTATDERCATFSTAGQRLPKVRKHQPAVYLKICVLLAPSDDHHLVPDCARLEPFQFARGAIGYNRTERPNYTRKFSKCLPCAFGGQHDPPVRQ